MSTATLTAIHLRAKEGALPSLTKSARVLSVIGLDGDYHAKLEDATKKNRYSRAVTLIEEEAVAHVAKEHGIKLRAEQTSRNLLTRGVDLNALVGREFTIGDPSSADHVVLRGTGLCHPCTSLEARTQPGVKAAFKGKGGLCAEIVKPGVVNVGDAIAAR